MSDAYSKVGDPPIVHDFGVRDGYDRVVRLVDRRLLGQAQARIAELEAAHRSDRNERWDDSVAPGGMVCAECGDPVESEPCELHGGGLEVADLVRGQLHEALNQRNEYRTERDHWRAEAEKAHTPERMLDVLARHRYYQTGRTQYDCICGIPCGTRSGWDNHLNRVVQSVLDDHAEADRLESESTADGLLPTVEESHRLDNATLDRLAGHFGIEVPAEARRPEATADDVVEKAAQAIRDGDWPGGDWTNAEEKDIARALHSAGLLRGDR